MISKEELNELKKQYEELSEKCKELTMEELEQVTGGKDLILEDPLYLTQEHFAGTQEFH